jgi:hypothetical protein
MIAIMHDSMRRVISHLSGFGQRKEALRLISVSICMDLMDQCMEIDPCDYTHLETDPHS